MTTHHPIDAEELMAYLDGELASEPAVRAAAHLENCVECRQLAADLRGLSKTMKTWEAPAPGDSAMPTALAAELDKYVAGHKAQHVPASERFTRPRFIPQGWGLRFAAACAVLLIVAAIAMPNLLRTRDYYAVMEGPRQVANRPAVSEQETPTDAGPVPTKRRHVGSDRDKAAAKGAMTSEMAGALEDGVEDKSTDFDVPPPTHAMTAHSRDMAAASSAPMIIRTAALALTTKDFDSARAHIEAMLKRRQGYVGSLNVTANPGAGRTLTASLRIPSTQLNDTLTELKTLGRLDSESQNGEDITSQYVDLQARLTNSRHTEQRLTDLLANRTGKLSDVLSVENELARVRGEIESMEAERKTMANQVDFATISLTINEDYRAQLQVVPPSTSTRLINAAVAGYRGLTDSLMSVALFFLESGPTLLLWAAILFFPARFGWKKLRQSLAHQS